ncbi:hypothetical protein [Paenibacillus sp. IITD108]|uniref:hypothetical protein n=1 Tax=Paenibacillus sp. IITD108 TaxID=3116649 RepID=UPI002F426A2B
MNRKKFVTIVVLSVLLVFAIPSVAFAAGKDEPWYVDIFVFLFDSILKPFFGISEPAEHVFQEHLTCDANGANCTQKYWGIFEYEEFNNAIFRGFAIFSIFVGGMFLIALIKLFVQFALSPLSSNLKLNAMDVGIKTFTALLLLMNFFTIVGLFFDITSMGVTLLERDIKVPLNLSEYGANLVGNYTGGGDRITVSDLAKDLNGLEQLIVNFFSIGISIWFEAFYIQRMFMIASLVVLAPIWIGTMFFPHLKGITGAAMKELWAQIISQLVHAVMFWLFFWLFKNKEITWLQLIISLAMFIPLSESIRFVLGATSKSSGVMATIGTMAGAGALMHGARAVKDVYSGIREGRSTMRSKGQSGASQRDGSGSVTVSNGGGAVSYRTSPSSNYSMTPARNAHQARLQGFSTMAAGIGRGFMRMGGATAGTALGPMGQFAFAEGFAAVGESAGHRAGAAAYGVGNRWMDKSKETYQNMKGNLESNGKSLNGIQRGGVAIASGVAGVGRTATPSKQFFNDPVYRRAAAEQAGGIAGEVLLGKGGYTSGADVATSKVSGITSSAGSFHHGESVFTVETRDGSWLAKKDNSGQYHRISNVGHGNVSLSKGQQAIKEYNVDKSDGVFKFKPAGAFDQTNNTFVERTAYSYDSEGNKAAYEGRTNNPMNFIEKKPINQVDIRRQKSMSSKDFTGDSI